MADGIAVRGRRSGVGIGVPGSGGGRNLPTATSVRADPLRLHVPVPRPPVCQPLRDQERPQAFASAAAATQSIAARTETVVNLPVIPLLNSYLSPEAILAILGNSKKCISAIVLIGRRFAGWWLTKCFRTIVLQIGSPVIEDELGGG